MPLQLTSRFALLTCLQLNGALARQNQNANAERASRWLVSITRIGRRQPGLDALERDGAT